MSIEQLPIQDVINGGDIIQAAENWNREAVSLKKRIETVAFGICCWQHRDREMIGVDAYRLQAPCKPARIMFIEQREIISAVLRFGGPEIEQNSLTLEFR